MSDNTRPVKLEQQIREACRTRTTMIYTHVASTGASGIRSPLDALVA